jgi:hypothetical protein
MLEFLCLVGKLIFVYFFCGLFFYVFMSIQGFWKTKELSSHIIFSFFWPISIASIYIAIKNRKEAEDRDE